MSICLVVGNRGGKIDDAKWLMETSKVASYVKSVLSISRDSREELLRHENLVIGLRVVQNDG